MALSSAMAQPTIAASASLPAGAAAAAAAAAAAGRRTASARALQRSNRQIFICFTSRALGNAYRQHSTAPTLQLWRCSAPLLLMLFNL